MFLIPTPTINEIPNSERPRERCLKQGAGCLSLRECLALIIGTGTKEQSCLGLAESILSRPGEGLPEAEKERIFFTAMESAAEVTILSGLPGLGSANQARFLATFELARRYSSFRESNYREARRSKRNQGAKERTALPEQAINIVPPRWRALPQEWLAFIPLHRSGRLGNFCCVEQGVRTHVNFDPLELFARLLPLRPAGFFLFHNHPGGTLEPSYDDVQLTRQVTLTARQIGIQLLGHGIITGLGERWIVV